jgi:hypothetical protein
MAHSQNALTGAESLAAHSDALVAVETRLPLHAPRRGES